MKIGIIQGTSQIDKNSILYECTKEYGEVTNFGCFENEDNYSYVEIALEICLLISSKAVDFIVTGCSSGQGMMIACNSLPHLICGYLPTPQDAYLFGRINDGNVASLPLGLNYGWAGEINLKATLQQLFEEPFGIGYPLKDAKRKKEDTILHKKIQAGKSGEKKVKNKRSKWKEKQRSIWETFFWFCIGAVCIVAGSELLVHSACKIAEILHISEAIISVTIVAMGTSLPELVTTVTAILKKESSLSVGNSPCANGRREKTYRCKYDRFRFYFTNLYIT